MLLARQNGSFETRKHDQWKLSKSGALCPATTAERSSDRGISGLKKSDEPAGLVGKWGLPQKMSVFRGTMIRNDDTPLGFHWIPGWVWNNWENRSFPMVLWCLTIFHDHKLGVMSVMFKLFGPNRFSLPAKALHFGFAFQIIRLYTYINDSLMGF